MFFDEDEDQTYAPFTTFNTATSTELDCFNNWRCKGCGTEDQQLLEQGDVWWVCINCGTVQPHLGQSVGYPQPAGFLDKKEYSVHVPPKRDPRSGSIIRCKKSYGLGTRRRYKREFYYRERLMQWICSEPPLRKKVLERFDDICDSGMYGSRRFLTKGDIMQMCKDNRMCKHKENWKTLLRYLREKEDTIYSYYQPDSQLLEQCAIAFSTISRRFDQIAPSLIKRYLNGSKGKLRHHILHTNYIHRKILESLGYHEFNREFSLLRTPSKVHALEDVMQIIAQEMGLKFNRSAVIAMPKCKNRFRHKNKASALMS
jgi:hypothetical protein